MNGRATSINAVLFFNLPFAFAFISGMVYENYGWFLPELATNQYL
jgi:hypothetical protein